MALLIFLLMGSAGAFGLRHKISLTVETNLDPHCTKGIVNTEMTVCCQGDCGECSDSSDLCSSNRTDPNNPTGRESTCCPGMMKDLPSCEDSMAPCEVPDSVRNPPSLGSLTAADRHAKDDCGKAKKAATDEQHLYTAYLKFAGKELASKTESGGCWVTTDCDKFGTLEQAAAACSNNDDCLGFDSTDGTPGCLVIAENTLGTLVTGTGDMFLKREMGFTGQIYALRSMGGTHKCFLKNPHGALKAKLGLCTSQVAMNELDGAEVYADLPRTACSPTPAPTPAPTSAPTEYTGPTTLESSVVVVMEGLTGAVAEELESDGVWAESIAAVLGVDASDVTIQKVEAVSLLQLPQTAPSDADAENGTLVQKAENGTLVQKAERHNQMHKKTKKSGGYVIDYSVKTEDADALMDKMDSVETELSSEVDKVLKEEGHQAVAQTIEDEGINVEEMETEGGDVEVYYGVTYYYYSGGNYYSGGSYYYDGNLPRCDYKVAECWPVVEANSDYYYYAAVNFPGDGYCDTFMAVAACGNDCGDCG